MTQAPTSGADESDIQLYTQGSCHAFALALNERMGTGFLVVLDPGNPYWEDPADADNAIASVTHVYAVDAAGIAWDVLGARPLSAVRAEILERHPDVLDYDTDAFPAPCGLATYVDGMAGTSEGDGAEDEADRPLHAVSRDDVDEAWACALRVLDGLPGFDPPGAPAP